ncbi:MAG: alpha/beta hydrolase, partial [Patescibacteria group bacterium]
LPDSALPSISKYNHFIFSSPWQFNSASILIGHSSGAVEVLALLQQLPEGVVVDTVVLVGAFKDDLGWESLQHLFDIPFDFEKIRAHAKRFVFIHSDNDPFCPLEGAEYLSEELGGELVVVPGAYHFSIGTGGERFRELPILLDILDGKK